MNHKLRKDIEIEFESMNTVVNESLSLLKKIGNDEPDLIQKTALSAFASQFYNGVENILKRIHKNNDIPLPTGDNWHIQLLQRFSPNYDFQFTLKFDESLYNNLNDLRRFRHYFFHGYSVNIDWLVLKESLTDIDKLYNAFKEALDCYFK